MKRCVQCGVDKPREDFNRRAASPDGLQYRCRECSKAGCREWLVENQEKRAAYRAKNKEAIDEYNRRYREEHPGKMAAYYAEHREELAEANRRRYEENRERYQATHRVWAEANADRVREYKRQWRNENAERLRPLAVAAAQKRLARKLDAFVENVHPLVVLERHDGVCGICGEDVDPLKFDVDHIIPLSRGGEHSYANTQPAHPFCNQSKGARLPEEMAA